MNHRITTFVTLICSAALAGAVLAQDQDPAAMSPEEQAMMAAFQASMTPGAPHQRLASLAGEFTATVKSYEDPSGEPEVSESTISRSMELGGRVLREEWRGTVMGMEFVGVGRTGYDNVTGRYWTTWTDNLSTGLFIGYGQWDEERDALVMEGEMPDPMTGEMVATRSVATYGDDGTEATTMYRVVQGAPVRIMDFEISPR